MKFIVGLLLIFAVLLLISFTAIGSSTYVPYAKDLLFSNMYPYEGFRNAKDPPTEYSTYPDHTSIDFRKNNEIQSTDSPCRKVTGFNGLFCASNQEAGASNPTDIYSTAQGDDTCESYGLMNSRGYLCLDANQKKMLTTRGGNATGKTA